MSEVKLAIIAEYKGVAIMERAGSKRAAWRGRDYFTDGLSYLMSQQPKGEEAVTLVGFPHEALIKEFLDEQPQADLLQWCSYEEAHRVICKSEPQGKPKFRWDDTQQVFILDEPTTGR